jgi:hypothetical protein
LAAITTVDPAADVLPIVDISDTSMAASGTTKKITSNQILGAGGTATLASATITGDLTVDTSTLKVDSTNNRVGIGTASPTSDLDIFRASGSGITSGISLRTAAGAGGDGSFIKWLSAGSNEKVAQIDGVLNGTDVGYLSFQCGNGADAMAEQYRIASSGLFTWYDGAGGTRMTLNSTGLGVGTTDTTNGRLNVRAGTAATGNSAFFINSDGTYNPYLQIQHSSAGIKLFVSSAFGTPANNLIFGNGGVSETMRIDGSGNVISNVTGTAPTLATNSQMVFNLTSNTNLRISVRGTDGTTRTANITLA